MNGLYVKVKLGSQNLTGKTFLELQKIKWFVPTYKIVVKYFKCEYVFYMYVCSGGVINGRTRLFRGWIGIFKKFSCTAIRKKDYENGIALVSKIHTNEI